uniref:Putative LOC101896122 [Musca domestica] n=1 Tax=Lepeophtheirus salmonis TaxID=72036 RepID=A0A0K2UYP2_LEPSM
MRYWAGKNPRVIHEAPLHTQNIIVWCGLHANGVIGPHFFIDDDNRHVTVNRNRYTAITTDFFGLNWKIWTWTICGFTSHTANVTIDLLKSKFGERLISRNGPVN